MRLSLVRFAILLYALTLTMAVGQPTAMDKPLSLPTEPGERWWGGLVAEGHKAPFGDSPYAIDLNGDNAGNQAQPLLLSNHGQYVWSEQPFAFSFADNTLALSHTHERVQQGRAGTKLREAYQFVSRTFFPPTSQMPDTMLFSQPQWNTWIELTYNQNQAESSQRIPG